MIPLRIYLKGFMSYLNAAELRFDGAPLWLLGGRNGAGKSAIFDAMTFALYGIHNRGDARLVKELIHKRADSLVVEFDFKVDGIHYRVKRTAAQRRSPTFQAFRLQDASNGLVHQIPIGETDSEGGLNRWVIEVIGLQAKAFTASVLLQQGKADALLEADPRDRHAILSQIIDLNVYERLFARADGQARSLQTKADLLHAQRDAIQPIDSETLDCLVTQIADLRAVEHEVQTQLEALLVCKEQAKRWHLLEEERQAIMLALEQTRQLFEQDVQIRTQAARHHDLQRVVPTLQNLQHERQNLLLEKHKIELREAARNARMAEIAQARTKHEEILQEHRTLADRLVTLEKERNRVQEVLIVLQPNMLALQQMLEIEQELTLATKALAAFPDNLPARINELQAEIDSLQEACSALPWLRQYRTTRADWHAAGGQECAATLEVKALGIATEQAQSNYTQAAERSQEARDTAQRLAAEQTRCTTLLKEAQSKLERFKQVDAQPLCIYCGQALSRDHLAAERERLQAELGQAQTDAVTAERDAGRAILTQREYEQTLEGLRGRIREVENALHAKEAYATEAQRNGQRALELARRALLALPRDYRMLVAPAGELEPVLACMDAYPQSADLAILEAETLQLDVRSQGLASLREQQEERVKCVAQQRSARDRLATLAVQYPAHRVTALRIDYKEAKGQQEAADAEITGMRPLVDAAYIECNQRAQSVTSLTESLTEIMNALTSAQATHQGLMRTIALLEDTLPIPWRAAAAALTADALADWQRELAATSKAPTQLATLEGLLREQQKRQDRLATITSDAHAIPVQSRRPVTAVEEEVENARGRREDAVEARTLAERTRDDLLAQQERRALLDIEARDMGHRALLHHTLANLLGRDRLQHHLLRQAEVMIVTNANAVLDRISGGMLRLDLPEHTSSGAVPKALDLIAYNTATSTTPLRVGFLSGSQRFRVAVSMALGIGQYANAGSHRVESVIIDEGFGSLDKEGRYEMIDELHALRDMLRCVILVSHQEEFATAFTNSYTVQIEDGSSTVRLLAE